MFQKVALKWKDGIHLTNLMNTSGIITVKVKNLLQIFMGVESKTHMMELRQRGLPAMSKYLCFRRAKIGVIENVYFKGFVNAIYATGANTKIEEIKLSF